jgi:hypothetical protein
MDSLNTYRKIERLSSRMDVKASVFNDAKSNKIYFIEFNFKTLLKFTKNVLYVQNCITYNYSYTSSTSLSVC